MAINSISNLIFCFFSKTTDLFLFCTGSKYVPIYWNWSATASISFLREVPVPECQIEFQQVAGWMNWGGVNVTYTYLATTDDNAMAAAAANSAFAPICPPDLLGWAPWEIERDWEKDLPPTNGSGANNNEKCPPQSSQSYNPEEATRAWKTGQICVLEFECCDCDGPSILYFFSEIIYSLFLKPYPFTFEFCLFHFQLSWAAEAADQNPSPNGRLVIM